MLLFHALGNCRQTAGSVGLDLVVIAFSTSRRTAVKLPQDVRTAATLCRQARPGCDLTILAQRGNKETSVTVRAGVVPFFLLG
jgi:hypothetical protein